MDWKLFLTTFVTIFIAELGDKTQFAAVAASAKSQSTIEILLAVILALSLAGTIGVLAGKTLATFLNPQIMKIVSGSLFIVVGSWILISKG
jgi:putative Ca2+/H+ antiporter (TMEM165/GDT1 family)